MIISSRQHPIVDAFRELADAPDNEGRRLLPDVDDSVATVAGAMTPRVGGVGPTTVAMLFRNAITAAERLSQ